ncbi:hypothetical protein QVD17_42510 [Tagetes erecta]|uniref:Uncharacterized protein n=1 Tax=Tagetes erecta TaxID=13708 RepID=A0AAD8JK32_TARER|nr:hypothetical protein QVD17_42510 [Tagetes erecta]
MIPTSPRASISRFRLSRLNASSDRDSALKMASVPGTEAIFILIVQERKDADNHSGATGHYRFTDRQRAGERNADDDDTTSRWLIRPEVSLRQSSTSLPVAATGRDELTAIQNQANQRMIVLFFFRAGDML